MPDISNPEQVTRQSGSNLALAFFLLPKERRRDITVFYAFCRVIDDLVDAPGRSTAEKQEGLEEWRRLLFTPGSLPSLERLEPGTAALAEQVRTLISKYSIPHQHFQELINGVEMDLVPAQYATWEDLRQYCYRVASVVGLISAEIFGYTNPQSRDYAVTLGYALQLTNIIRDVATDIRNEGRIYLPEDEMAAHGVTPQSLAAGEYTAQFQALMRAQAARAWGLYALAREQMPQEDRRSMLAADMMSLIYERLLRMMEQDGFRVFQREYRLTRAQKLSVIARVFLRKLLRV